MKNRVITILIITLLLVPQITFAAWWNPLSWFSRKNTAQVQVVEIGAPVKVEDDKPNSAIVPELKPDFFYSNEE